MANVTVTQADNGKAIKARQGDEIVVSLPENATTGYRWYIDRADGVVPEPARQQLEENVSPPGPDTMIGRGGIREFRFRFEGPDQGRIELKHMREWEGDASVTQRFNVELVPLP